MECVNQAFYSTPHLDHNVVTSGGSRIWLLGRGIVKTGEVGVGNHLKCSRFKIKINVHKY